MKYGRDDDGQCSSYLHTYMQIYILQRRTRDGRETPVPAIKVWQISLRFQTLSFFTFRREEEP